MDAALVLCGGRSRRMGRDKASLEFGPERMLERMVRILSEAVDEVWVVAREGQDVPADLRVVRDPADGLGPLAGLASGLAAVEARRVFVTACDTPLLRPAFVERMLALADGYACAVPVVDGHWMVLSAVYEASLHTRAQALLDAGERRPRALCEQSHTRIVHPEDVRTCDPDLESLMGCNSKEEYAALVSRAGLGPHPRSLDDPTRR